MLKKFRLEILRGIKRYGLQPYQSLYAELAEQTATDRELAKRYGESQLIDLAGRLGLEKLQLLLRADSVNVEQQASLESYRDCLGKCIGRLSAQQGRYDLRQFLSDSSPALSWQQNPLRQIEILNAELPNSPQLQHIAGFFFKALAALLADVPPFGSDCYKLRVYYQQPEHISFEFQDCIAPAEAYRAAAAASQSFFGTEAALETYFELKVAGDQPCNYHDALATFTERLAAAGDQLSIRTDAKGGCVISFTIGFTSAEGLKTG